MVDLERALQFAADLGLVSTVDEFTRLSLSGLDALVPAELWGFNDLDPGSHEMVAAIWPPDGARPEDFAAVAKVVWQHPVVARFQRTGDGPPTRISDVWSASRYRESALYRDAYRAMGVEYQVSFSLADGPVAATIGFAANRSDRDFTDAELDLLAMLRPALRAAWQRVQATSALVATIGYGGSPSGCLLLVDARSRVRAAPEQVARLLGDAGVAVTIGATIPEPVLGWLGRASGQDGLTIGGPGHEVHLSVVAGARDADRVVEVRPVPPVAGDHFGLTARELEVVRLAASGMTNAEIGRSLAISARTVQKHLERSFEKLGVHNRTAAAALLGSSTAATRRLGADTGAVVIGEDFDAPLPDEVPRGFEGA